MAMRVGVITVLGVLASCAAGKPGKMQPPVDAAPLETDSTTTPDLVVQRYTATLAMTSTVPFGGAPYCRYSNTLKNILFDVSTSAMPELTTLKVTDTSVEAIVGTCTFPPASPAAQVFGFHGAPISLDANGTYMPVIDGLPNNQPKTALTMVVHPISETSIDVTASWHRTDQVAILNWTVMTAAPVHLALAPCDKNDVYCLGDRTVGSLFVCTDGTHLLQQKPCTAGCAPPQAGTPHVDETCN